MSLPLDLEALKEVFSDKSLVIAIGKITLLSVAPDRSGLKVMVSLFPDMREIVCRMSWEMVGPECGIFSFPQVNDLVLVGFAEKDFNLAFVIRRLTSIEDKIPLRAVDGHLVVKALPGKQLWATGSRVMLSQGDSEPTEPIVLGGMLQALLIDILGQLQTLSSKLALHTHITTAPGALTSPPKEAPDFTATGVALGELKASPVEDGTILSDFAFTEKGAS